MGKKDTAIEFNLLARRARPIVVGGLPTFATPDSQMVSASQFYEPACRETFDRMGFPLTLDRKAWEYGYILHAIKTYARTGHGARGLAFGCGKEVLTSILAAGGASILATDYVPERISDRQWEARGLEDLFFKRFIDQERFLKNVTFRHLDMNDIDPDIAGFDFCWSTGSLEHIGGHANGLAFIERSMACLRPGGIAVHTTEFTLTSDTSCYDTPDLSFYCRKDIEELATRLLSHGHVIVLNFDRGNTVADLHVDLPPYHAGHTLTAHFSSHVITSIGLIIQRSKNES